MIPPRRHELASLCGNAGGVWLASGSLADGSAGFVLHFLTDLGKGECLFGIAVDRALHVAWKLASVTLIFMAG